MVASITSDRQVLRGVDVGDGGHIVSTDTTDTASAVEVPMDEDGDSGRIEFGPDFAGACTRLVGLTEEGVFRVIVGFL